MSQATLSLSVNNSRQLQSLLIGLEDQQVREGLISNDATAPEIKELATLVGDPEFLGMASSIVTMLEGSRAAAAAAASDGHIRLLQGERVEAAPAPTAGDIREAGAQLKTYLQKGYPGALSLLESYASTTRPAGLTLEADDDGVVGANLYVAANAAAVVNAAAWANVAVATQAVVAAAAVVVLGVFVI